MSVKKIVAINTVSQLIGKLIGAGTSFVVAFLLARRLGAEGYGDFTKITTFVAPFFLLADFGLNAIFLQKKDDKGWWAHLLGLRVAGSTILIFLALAILAFLPHGTNQGYTALVRLGIVLFVPAILFQALITTSNALFQKHLRYSMATIAIAAGSFVTILLVLPLSTGVLAATLAVLVGTSVTAAISLVLVKRHTLLSVALSRQSVTGLLVPSIPLGITLLFNLVYFRADNYIITLSRPTVEVGVYGLAYKVFEVALVVPTFFMNAVYPLLLSAKANNSTIQQF
ncbi:MAG: oligosaccharide flippase family protein, partial [Patescibacteria group bacterium]